MQSQHARRFAVIALLHAGLSLLLQSLLRSSHADATLWPAAGVSLGLLFVWGGVYWPAVAIGAFVVYVADGYGVAIASALALVMGTSAWLGVWVTERFVRVRLTLPAVRDIARMAIAGMLLAPLWFAVGTALVLEQTTTGPVTTGSALLRWWFSYALGALAFTPLIVAWRGVNERVRRSALEWTALVTSTAGITAALLFGNVGYSAAFVVLALTAAPLMLWSAKRFGIRVTTALNSIIALATAIGFTNGSGLFALSSTGASWAPQLFTAWTVMISLIFASSVRERDLVVEQLQTSEARLTSVINSSQDQIALLAVDNGQVRALEMGNRALFNALRAIAPTLETEDLVGRTNVHVSERLADSLQALAPMRDAIQESITTLRTTEGTHELKTQFGERVLEATTVPVRDRNGVVTHVLWQSRDVTARVEAERSLRASEARWRSLIEASPQFIMLLDRERRLTFINRVVAGLDASQVLGTRIDDYMMDDHNRAVARENLAAVIERGETRVYEVYALGEHGQPAWYRCHVGPVLVQGQVVAAMVLASDTTDQKRGEDTKRLLEQQLYQSQKMESLGTLAGGIAHDFNNVLAGIMANAELLRDVVAHDQEASDSIRDILAAGKRARDVVRQILAFSRRQPLERRAVKLSDVILEAMTLLRASLPTSVKLRTTMRAAQVRVFADETQLHQVVMNLATNAAQAIGDAGGDIEFDSVAIEVSPSGVWTGVGNAPLTRPHLAAGRYARLTVKDNGIGMDRATLARIFDPFFTTKPMEQGTGLGLAVVHGIVTSHNGVIVADSEPGVGTIMAIYLPLYNEEQMAPAPAAPVEAGAVA